MTKAELIRWLEPYADDTEVLVSLETHDMDRVASPGLYHPMPTYFGGDEDEEPMVVLAIGEEA